MLYEKIKTIYPELTDVDFMKSITLQNDSMAKAITLLNGNTLLAKPTEEQLA